MMRAILTSLVLLAHGPLAAEPMLLAAASTGRAIDAVLAESGLAAVTSYGASGILARQIEQGAPTDLFLSANPKWMAHLVEAGLVDEGQVTILMSNRLVLIAPAGSEPVAPEALAACLDGEVFAMADPASAPVGAYGRSALEALGLWDAVEPRFVPVRNTLATVMAVSRGEAALGLVYASDAADQPGVEVVWSVPADSHPEIRYLLAPVAQGEDPDGAAALQSYLQSPEGRAVLARFGFLAVEDGA